MKPEPNACQPDSGSKPQSWQVLNVFTNRHWLKDAGLRLLAFLPACIFPAVITTFASVLIVIGLHQGFAPIHGSEIAAALLIGHWIKCLVFVSVGWLVLLWGFTQWLFALTAFCHFWLTMPSLVTNSEMKSARRNAMTEVRTRSSFLVPFWFWLALFISPALVTFFLLLGLGYASFVSFGANAIPRSIQVICIIGMVLLLIGLMMVSLVGVVVSSKVTVEPLKACRQVFKYIYASLWPSIILVVIVVAVNWLVGELHIDDRSIFGAEAYRGKSFYFLATAEQIWQGLTSIILYPLSLIPFCELLRGSLKEPN